MSRMFLFENWQLLISSLEIYRHYGADLIVTYLDSLLSDIYKILRVYESEGFLLLKPAVRFIQPVSFTTFHHSLNFSPTFHMILMLKTSGTTKMRPITHVFTNLKSQLILS
jgi:hypothetical protein